MGLNGPASGVHSRPVLVYIDHDSSSHWPIIVWSGTSTALNGSVSGRAGT